MGLRERKKNETRQALSDAALHLTVARGLEHVRVEDIAAAANVSPRTFNNYFSSKQEAIVWRLVQRTGASAELLRARPADEPLWEAITKAVPPPYDLAGTPSDSWLAGVRQMVQNPALQGEVFKQSYRAEQELAAAVAERTGTDPEHDMTPRLVAGAVNLALRVATEQWLRAEPPVPIDTLLRRALDELRRSLTEEPS